MIRKGHTLQAQLLCAGEFKAAIDLYAYRLADLKHTRGCPVELSFPDPTRQRRVRSASSSAHRVLTLPPCCLTTSFRSRRKEFLPKLDARQAGAASSRAIAMLDVEAKGVKILLLTPDDAVQFDKPYQQLREEFLLNR